MIKMCRNMEIVVMVPVKLGQNLYISQRVIPSATGRWPYRAEPIQMPFLKGEF